MKARFISILLLIFTLVPSLVSVQVNKQDSLILIEFMNSMGIQYWNPDKQVERWTGIDVTGNRVSGITSSNPSKTNYRNSLDSHFYP